MASAATATCRRGTTTSGRRCGYEDIGLLSGDPELTGADVAALFNYVTGFGQPAEFRRLRGRAHDLCGADSRVDRP